MKWQEASIWISKILAKVCILTFRLNQLILTKAGRLFKIVCFKILYGPVEPLLHMRGISDPPALLFCPTRAVLSQTPTPQTRRISVGWTLNARDPQTFTSTDKPRPLRPAQPCRSSISLGRTPQPCTISALLATPPKPAQHCTIFTLQGCAPSPSLSKLGIHRYSGYPLHPSGMPSPCSKSPLLYLSKGLHPKAHGTPPTIHLPREGSKPT
jgi:hypothetical protein